MASNPMKTETHRIPVSGGEAILVDWTPPAAGNSAAAVFLHGLGSHRRGDKSLHFAQRFAELGWGYLALDMRGHGESDGSMRQLSLSRCMEDVRAALAWLPQDVQPRLLIGSSMGGAVAAWYRLLHPGLAGLTAFIAPSFTFPSNWVSTLSAEELHVWQRDGVQKFRSEWLDLEIGWELVEDARRYDPARLVREHTTPTLILHGMKDATVDWRASADFVERCPCKDMELVLIKQGDHRLTEQKAYLFDLMAGWLRARGIMQP